MKKAKLFKLLFVSALLMMFAWKTAVFQANTPQKPLPPSLTRTPTAAADNFGYVIYECPGGVGNVPVYPVPALPRPAKGVAIQDPNFHTTITRISDKAAEQYWGERMTNIYSTVDIENADNTKFILTSGKFYIYDAY